jgi:hypothetical protein
VKGFGFQTGDFKILSFDLRDTLYYQSSIIIIIKENGDLSMCRI